MHNCNKTLWIPQQRRSHSRTRKWLSRQSPFLAFFVPQITRANGGAAPTHMPSLRAIRSGICVCRAGIFMRVRCSGRELTRDALTSISIGRLYHSGYTYRCICVPGRTYISLDSRFTGISRNADMHVRCAEEFGLFVMLLFCVWIYELYWCGIFSDCGERHVFEFSDIDFILLILLLGVFPKMH